MRLCLFLVSLVLSAPAWADDISADEFLRRVDRQSNAFRDAIFRFKMQIKESSGQVREVEYEVKQKGAQKRILNFLAPGDIKGMGFLVESADTMYALLPAFGNRVRRLGTHQKSASFMGSDLEYEDMSAIELGAKYAPKYAAKEDGRTVLELALRPGQEAEYPRLKLWAAPDSYVIYKIEYYDKEGKKLRTQLRDDFKKDESGKYYSPYRIVFIDHRRSNHETDLLLQKVQYDSALGDDKFSVRALQRQ